MIFEHAYRLKLKGFDVSITFKHVENGFDSTVFPHSEEISIIEYGSRKEFDFVIATFWSTVYDLSEFQAKYYLYFNQCDERLFYEEADARRFWVEQTYAFTSLLKVASAKLLSDKLSIEFCTKTAHVPYGIDLQKFNSTGRRTANEKIRLLIEGPGLAKFKRVDDAFKVAAGVDGIEVWYVTYDGHVAPQWKPDKVFSKVPYHEMPNIYRSCDILLKLSVVESFGLPNLEMMACGGAVITSSFTGHEEYAIEGENAFIVDTGDIQNATKRLQLLVNDAEQRSRFGENGLKAAKVRDWHTLKPDYAMILEQIVVENPNGNKDSCLPRLENLSLGFREHEALAAQKTYMDSWQAGIVKREATWMYRIANKLYQWFEKQA
jgi:glycosyltransferase involved in cell wall biosynthesis